MNAIEGFDRPRGLLVASLFVALCAGIAGAQEEPKAQAKQKRPDIYNQKLDAREQVATACARAKKDNTRVLLMFGGNWCGWCHKLHELFASDPESRKVLSYEYVLVTVDLESPNADELLKKCKAALSPDDLQKGVGYPFLAVLDADAKVITAQRTDPLEAGDHHDPKKVNEFLTRWVPEPIDAQKALGDALARASSEEKRVFLHFGAPWCGWCHKLEDFLARPEIAEIVSRDYVDLKIDTDRMKQAKSVLDRYYPNASGGIPWMAILDGKGNVLATSDSPKGNIGYPAEPHEIQHFMEMLNKTKQRIESKQLGQLEQALQEEAEKINAQRRQ
jgi:uncharacterized protein YyaL (SSP411 family)